jgi:hypothetical protein
VIVLTLIVTNDSLAYWASSIVVPNSVDSSVTINIGEWNQAFPYDSNTTYEVGDLVIFNGVTYEAISSFLSNIIPPGGGFLSRFAWRVV